MLDDNELIGYNFDKTFIYLCLVGDAKENTSVQKPRFSIHGKGRGLQHFGLSVIIGKP